MKNKAWLAIVVVLVVSSLPARADVVFSGTAVNSIALGSNPAGSLALMVAGPFDFNLVNTATTLNLGDGFGGGTIFARNSIQDVFGTGVISSAASFLLPSDPGAGLKIAADTPFRVVWFTSVASTETSLASFAGATYRTVSVGSWTTPASDGAFTFAESGGDYLTLSGASPSSFTVIPEPTAAALLGLGLLGLLVRRRRA